MIMQENLFVFHFFETFKYNLKGKNNVLYTDLENTKIKYYLYW